jgi:tetratricopeptide (TPR) repeat protein
VLDEKERKLREERKKEERERWWAGVEIFKPKPAISDAVSAKPSQSQEEADKTAMMLNRYKADYSHWNSWTPTDEASLAEQAEVERKEEEARNKEFEKNNAEFCDQFLTDMEKRKKVTEKKQESADISRLKGNRYFKARSYEKALELYMEALRECPFDAKTVNNVAQVSVI